MLLIFLHTFPPGFLLALYSRAVLHQLIKGFLNANLLAFRSNSKEEILVCYFRTAKSLNSSLVIVLSFLNSHLSILDFGLPVSFNHLFLENKHETSKHSLITTTTTTTTKNIILLTKLPKLKYRAKILKPRFAKRQAFKVHHHHHH